MRLIELIVAAGYADTGNEARRLVKQGGVRMGLLSVFNADDKDTAEFAARCDGKQYIETYDKLTDPNMDVDLDAPNWFLLVGKLHCAHILSIMRGFTSRIPMLVIDIDDRTDIHKYRAHGTMVDADGELLDIVNTYQEAICTG